MPIASMLEADKPFMFAASSSGRPATAADLSTIGIESKSMSSNSTSTPGSAAAAGNASVPKPPLQQQAQQHKQQPLPPPPPQPAPTPVSLSDQRHTGPPPVSAPSTAYYHPHAHHYHHHHHHHRQQYHLHPQAATGPAPPQEDEHFLFHHHHQQAPPTTLAYGRHQHEQENVYTFRPSPSSSSSNHPNTSLTNASLYQQRRLPQHQVPPPPPPPPHHHHHHHHHQYQSMPYHVHRHAHQHPSLPPQPQTVVEDHGPYSLSASGSSNVPTPLYMNDADEAELWFEGHYDGTADNRRYKKRKELTGRMEKINADFMDNRERIYAEKLAAIQNEIRQVYNNTHASYLEGLAELERIREKTIQDGRLLREYQERITDKQYHEEISLAEEEYLAEKQEMREKLFATLEERRRKLKEEKDNCELTYDVVMESQARMLKRNLRRRGLEQSDSKSNKRKQTSGPSLVFKLKEEEINADLEAMRIGTPYSNSGHCTTSASSSSKKSTAGNKKK